MEPQMKLKASASKEPRAARPDPDEDEEMLEEELGGDDTTDEAMDGEDEEMEDDADGSPTR
jgi:hypothetical protein